jgi:hypothetical protein
LYADLKMLLLIKYSKISYSKSDHKDLSIVICMNSMYSPE